MSDPTPPPLALEPEFDAGATPATCETCGQVMIRVSLVGEPEPRCPLCLRREASGQALEAAAVAIGPWPRVVVRRGPPLLGGARSLSVPGSEATLEAPEGLLARLRRDGERLFVVIGAEERELAPGARFAIGARDFGRD